MEIICPNCKGHKYVFDKSSLASSVAFPFIWGIETLMGDYDSRSITRKKCEICKGKGRVYLKN